MSKPRKRGTTTPYAIYYKDGSYMIYDLTKADYDALTTGIRIKAPASLTVGFLVTDEIRAVIEQLQPKEEKQERPALPDMPEEYREYYKGVMAGIYDEEVDFS
jgi:hypothetical protein